MASLRYTMPVDVIKPEPVQPKTIMLPPSPSPCPLSHRLCSCRDEAISPPTSIRLPGIHELDLRIQASREEEEVAQALLELRYQHSLPSPSMSWFSRNLPVLEPPPPPPPSTQFTYPFSPPMTVLASPSCRSISRSMSPARNHNHHHQGTSNITRMIVREDRHEYDSEEQYAICFLRMQSNASQSRWKDLVERNWCFLFPPGQLRRATAPTQPGKTICATYVVRSSGGLQCRYYRLRDQLGVGGVRKGRRNAVVRNEVGALRRCELELAQYWYKMLSVEDVALFELGRQPQEDDVGHMSRVRAGYRERSEFWQLLSKIPDVNHYS